VPDIAKVVDFGLVKEIAEDTRNTARLILGTPAYIAPEAVSAPETVGPAGDLYALGATGYFLLTAKPVFGGESSVEVCIAHVENTPVPPSKVTENAIPDELEAIILSLLSKDPIARPDATTLAKRLRALAPTNGWSDAAAHDWWIEFRKKEKLASALATEPTITMTIDLGQREPS
jgi:serine/threonine protein kinase